MHDLFNIRIENEIKGVRLFSIEIIKTLGRRGINIKIVGTLINCIKL